jgi:hypothetical protein
MWIAYYNYRVTTNPFRLPYQVWQETYTGESLQTGTLFFFTSADGESAERRPRSLGNEPTRAQWELWNYRRRSMPQKVFRQWAVYGRIILLPAVFMLPFVCRSRRMRFAVLTCALVFLAVFLQNTHGHARYAAPVGGLVMVLIVQGLRHVRLWKWRGKPAGRTLVPMLVTGYAFCFFLRVAVWTTIPMPDSATWCLARAQLQRQLEDSGEKHLVIVRSPSPSDVIWPEWVANRSDIDAAGVVWARDLGTLENRRLLRHFPDRKPWLLYIDSRRMVPYGEEVGDGERGR